MTAEPKITQQEKEIRYGFGDNWADYATHISDEKIIKAEEGLNTLLNGDKLTGKTMLDIGCGSGLHALAGLRKGAAHVTAVDLDHDSINTTRAVLMRFWIGDNYDIAKANILNPSPRFERKYDLVYSWGVLHHTGDMWKAIDNAAKLVKPDGTLILALYKKTPLCGFWRVEKKLYTLLPKFLRAPIEWLYAGLYILGLCVKGTNPVRYIRNYHERRGMRFITDIRDWLGGTPYDSAAPKDVVHFLTERGYTLIRSLNTKPAQLGGLFGSGCAEYVFRKG